MANMIQNAKDSINALLQAACEKAAEKGRLPAGAALTGTVEFDHCVEDAATMQRLRDRLDDLIVAAM